MNRFFVPSHLRQVDGIPVVRLGIIGIQFDSLFQFLLGAREVPIIKKGEEAQGGMRLAERWIQFQGLDSSLPGLNRAVKVRVAIQQAGVGQGISWVLLDSLLEELQSFLDTL